MVKNLLGSPFAALVGFISDPLISRFSKCQDYRYRPPHAAKNPYCLRGLFLHLYLYKCLPILIYMYYVCTWCLQRLEVSFGFPGTGVSDDCEPEYVGTDN